MTKRAERIADLPSEVARTETLESALLRLALDFVNLPVDEIDAGIEKILECVGNFTNADCCGVSEFTRETGRLRDVSLWTRPGTPSRADVTASVDMTGLEPLFENPDEPTLIVDVETDSRLAKSFGEAFAAFGIRSLAWFPVSADERVNVAVGITAGRPTQWDAEHISLLRVAGKLIANLRTRSRTTSDLVETTLLFEELSKSIEQNFFLWETDPPKLLYSNEAIETVCGMKADTYRNDASGFVDLVLPEYRESFVALFRNGRTSPQELEYRVRHVDGSIRWLRTRVFPVKNPQPSGSRIAGLTEDITQRVNITDTGVRLKEFELLLSRISSRFVETPLGEMDSAIGEALAEVASFADVEHAHVYLLDRNRATLTEVADWHATGRETGGDALQFMPLFSLPFFAGTLLNGRTITLANPDDLPVSAAVEKAFLARHEIRSCIVIPLATAVGVIGTLVLATTSRSRTWSVEETSMLRVSGDVVAAAAVRRESEREQQRGLHFERLVTALVSEFMNLPASELDAGIGRALETIAGFVECDRSGLFILDSSGDGADLSHGWWAPGSAPVVNDYDRVETGPHSLYGSWIRSSEPSLIVTPDSVESFRPDAARAMREHEMGAIANLALTIDGNRVGWFAVGAKAPRMNWDDAELRSLQVAADALANMYARRTSEEEKRRHQLFDDTLSRFATDFIKRPVAQIRAGIEDIVDGFGRFSGCDRAALLLLDRESGTASTYHEWVSQGVPARVENFPIRDAPWFYRQVITATGPWFMHRDEFPPSDEAAAFALDAIGMRTLLNCPIADDERVFGYASIGFSRARHRPPPGTEQVMAVASGIIANALARERLEQESAAQRDALSRALRLGSMGQLATGIAHELNQPLTAIANYSRACVRMLEREQGKQDGVSGILERVYDEALRAGDIIHNLRNHVKGGRPHRKPTAVKKIVDHACSLLSGTVRENRVEMIVEHAASLPSVHVESTEIEQVVINLVQNAVDAIVASASERREIRIRTRRNRSFVEIEVADTGPGFSDEEAEKIFDQFHTTKTGGLGLGLSISRHLIESNGGTIEAAGRGPSGGAVFLVAVPVAGATLTGADGGRPKRKAD